MTLQTKCYETTQYFDRKMMSLLWSNTKIDKAERDKLKMLYDTKKKKSTEINECSASVMYKLTVTTPGRLGYGRYYSHPVGLERLEKSVRGTLCRKLYDDLDIVNCHPVIIHQYAKRHFNQDMPNLLYYISNRDAVFAQMKKDFYLSKEEVKTQILKVLYGGLPAWLFDYEPFIKNLDIAPKLFEDISEEMKILTGALIARKDHDELYQALKRDKGSNVKGRFLSLIVQREERTCLDALIAYITSQNLHADVPSYDGCMIRGVGSCTPEIIAGTEKAIFDATGYAVRLAIKAMDYYTEEALVSSHVKENDEYQTLKNKWEADHFYFKPLNTICEIDRSNNIKHYDIGHSMEAFNMWKLKEDEKEILFLDKWRKDPTRRVIEEFVMKMPEECLPHEYSLFKGFAYQRITCDVTEEERSKYITFFEDLLHAVCNDEPEVYTYLLKYFGHLIQCPFKKTDVAIYLCSYQQGTGKDTFMGIIGRVIGSQHFAHYSDAETYWGKHNTMKEGAIIEYMEDADESYTKGHVGAMKSRITGSSITVQPKGKTEYNCPNIANQIATLQDPKLFSFEDSDRRGNLIMCSSRLKNIDWKEKYKMIIDPKFTFTIGKYLENVILGEWNPRLFPETEFKQEVKNITRQSEKIFLEQYTNAEWVSSVDFFKEYKLYCQENDLPHAMNTKSFGLRILPYRGTLIEKKISSHNEPFYRSPQ
jgi:hypothetical protein